jgi:predicted methyltransferase
VIPCPEAPASPLPSAACNPPPPGPTAEEKKKADDSAKLEAARAAWQDKNKAELARWTPEMHAAAQALAATSFPGGKAGIQAAMKGTHRAPGAADRDKYRHPAETLDFLGFTPTMTVVDVDPQAGWYTDLLAPALASRGQYIAVVSSDANSPAGIAGTLNGDKFAALLAKAPELYGKVVPVIVDGTAPKLGIDGKADLVLVMREVHNWKNRNTVATWLAQIRAALKPGGILGIEEHRAAPGTNPDETSKKGYIPEKWLIAEVEVAGFRLVGKSEINANAKDTKDYPDGVWDLPPNLRGPAQDRDKYAAIGESDRMTLKFAKK